MSVARTRKEASKRLGLALYQRYEKLATATGQDEVVVASVDLGQCFNDNIEFIIWVLKTYGGMDNLPAPDLGNAGLKKALPAPANDLPQTPAIFTAGAAVDMLGKKPH